MTVSSAGETLQSLRGSSGRRTRWGPYRPTTESFNPSGVRLEAWVDVRIAALAAPSIPQGFVWKRFRPDVTMRRETFNPSGVRLEDGRPRGNRPCPVSFNPSGVRLEGGLLIVVPRLLPLQSLRGSSGRHRKVGKAGYSSYLQSLRGSSGSVSRMSDSEPATSLQSLRGSSGSMRKYGFTGHNSLVSRARPPSTSNSV